MTKATNKSATKPRKTRGRQSDFSGEKQAYLDSLAKDFLNRKDRSTFYDEAAQGLFDKFGYSRDGKVYVEADTLSAEEQLEYYQALRGKLGQWFRHRYLAKSSDRTYVAEIVNSIKSAASPQPRKRSAISMYMEKNKEKLTSEFAIHWSAVQNDLSQKKRLPKYNEFVQTCWKKEPQSCRDEMERDVQEEHDNAICEWKEKIETFNGSPEDFQRAWGMAERVLPSFADGFADWLGANVIIVAVSPNPSNGEITIQSVQSDCSKGHMKTLLPQFDEKGWKKLQEMVITYGKAFFSPEECKRRIVKTEDDDSDAEMDATVSGNSICVDVNAEGNNAAGGNSINKSKDVSDADGESDLDVPGDAGLEKDMERTDINEDTRPAGSTAITDDAPGAMMMDSELEKTGGACAVQGPDDKSSAETTSATINGGNPPSPILPGPSPTSSSTTLTTDINGGNSLFTGRPQAGPFPIVPTTEINGENANSFDLHLAGFNFPQETHGTHIPGSTFNPYPSDFTLTSNNWSAFPAHPATPSLNPSMDFWFGNAEYNPSGLTFPQDTTAFLGGGFAGNLYKSLNSSVVPSSPYALPGPLFHHGQPMLEIPSPSHSVTAPINQPEGNVNMTASFAPFLSSQQLPSESSGAFTESPSFMLGIFPPTANTTVQESAKVSDEGSNTSQGRKRKGDELDELVAKPAKKACSRGTENEDMPGESAAGKQLDEGTEKSDEVNERAGKPTLSGRIPLMPTHLAEAGYQGEKKGVRPRKVQPTKKPKSKGNATKPASKATKPASKATAKTPAKKKVK